MNLNTLLQNFHFLRPLWLLALPVLLAIVVWLARQRSRGEDWSEVIDAELLPALQLDTDSRVGGTSARPWPWLALAWTLAVLAMAGPSWQQDSAPAYRAPAAWVLVLDLSPSMDATDLPPNRVTRARYALDDILSAARDARVGMVAFSDEAYTVTPLTQDVATIRALIPSLAPEMMPSTGDHLAPALAQAQQLLNASGARDKRMVVVSDGFDDPAAVLRAAAAFKAQGITISVVGAGTPGGAPLRSANGSFAQTANGQTQLTKLNVDQLQQLASSGGGQYVDITKMASLVSSLQRGAERSGEAIAAPGVEVAHWLDAGAYLLPALLLLVALLARRRWL
jgi:Ca-activated chloride channel homolog